MLQQTGELFSAASDLDSTTPHTPFDNDLSRSVKCVILQTPAGRDSHSIKSCECVRSTQEVAVLCFVCDMMLWCVFILTG